MVRCVAKDIGGTAVLVDRSYGDPSTETLKSANPLENVLNDQVSFSPHVEL